MKVFGIIIEGNPFHNGHKYLIDKIRVEYSPDYIIVVTSTSFTMRGEISLINKFDKTKIYLDNNVDLVFELPINKYLHSAKFFSANAINILSNLGITDLAFGSECDNISLYEKLYSFQKANDNEKDPTKSSKNSLTQSLLNNNFSNEEINIINMPNFILSYEYYKKIKNDNLDIKLHLVKRIDNNYFDKIPTSNIASATSIRNLSLNNLSCEKYIPYDEKIFIDLKTSYQNLFLIAKNSYLLDDNNSTFLQKEGLYNYIKKNGDFSKNFEELQNSLKSKKYTISCINRSIIHQIIKTKDTNTNLYLRLLGASTNGFSYIKDLDKEVKSKIFSSPNELKIKNIDLEYEITSTKLYSIITNNNELLLKEYKLPIRKE